jgi:ABC-type polysaccharide/polyol phosphate export permease
VLFIVPALVILTINGIWVSILLGMISARYRDVPPIIMNFVTVRRAQHHPTVAELQHSAEGS